MSSTLSVNHEEYQTSAEIARRFGYTKDYVTKLAREEKIEARQVGRQWFIDPDAFAEFFIAKEVEKHQRSEQLRKERKLERALIGTTTTDTTTGTSMETKRPRRYFAVEACLVMMCGLLVGQIGWIAQSAHLNVTDAVVATRTVTNQLRSNMLPAAVDTAAPHHVLARLVGSLTGNNPQSVVAAKVTSTENANTYQQVQHASTSLLKEFSDPVHVSFRGHGSGTVEAVFRDGTHGRAYRVSLQPVATSTS